MDTYENSFSPLITHSLHELVELDILLEEEARGGVGERVGEVQAQVERGVGGGPEFEPGLPALSAGG